MSILLCSLLLTCCGKGKASEEVSAGGYTTNSLTYGHYLVFDDESKMDIHGDKKIVDIIKKGANPNIIGLKMKYLWKNLEPQEGVYDFSTIEKDLNYCKSLGRKMIVLLMDKTFNNVNLRYLPSYLDNDDTCLYIQGTTGGWTPVRWSPLYIERLDLLMKAMAQKFDLDPYFAGVSYQETALSVPQATLTSLTASDFTPFEPYTAAKYNDALKTIVTNTAKAFKHSAVFWQINGQGGTNNADLNFFKSDLQYFIDNNYRNIVVVQNDILPYRPVVNRVGIPLNNEFKGLIPLAGTAAYSAYNTHVNDITNTPTTPPLDPVTLKGVYTSMQEIFDFATQQLYTQIIFWVYVPGTSSAHRTDPDVLKIIADNPLFNEPYQIK